MKKSERKSLHFADDMTNEKKDEESKESLPITALEEKLEKKSILKKSTLESPIKNQSDNLENNIIENNSDFNQIPKLNLNFSDPQSEPSKETTTETKFIKKEIKDFDDDLINILNEFKFKKEEENQPNFQKNKERNFKIMADKNADFIEESLKSGVLNQALIEVYKKKLSVKDLGSLLCNET